MNRKVGLVILFSILVFIPSWGNYFSGDDWYHSRLGQISSIGDFLNYFSFKENDQTASFYRPLSTQVFFFVFQKVFGLWSLPWYVFVSLMFGISIYLVYKVTQETAEKLIVEKEKYDLKYLSLTAASVYGLSVTNFTHLYFLSTFQEIGMVIGVLGAFWSYLKGYKLRILVFWILGLLCKETAIVLPGLILVYELINKVSLSKISIKNLTEKIKFTAVHFIKQNLAMLVIGVIYLYLRLGVFQAIQGDSYVWNFSPVKAANTLTWYVLWSLGVPEMVIDFIGSGLRPIPRFYSVFGIWWIVIVTGLFITATLMMWIILGTWKQINKLDLVGGSWYVIALLPVIFLPLHKFTLELGLPMVGFSVLIASLIIKTSNSGKILLGSFVIFNLLMNRLTWEHHYSVNRSVISRKVVDYMETNYPVLPSEPVWFVDSEQVDNKDWGGSSKQVSNSVGKSELFKVLYRNQSVEVFFEGVDDQVIPENAVKIESQQFLNL